jgi:hypothetical protein
MCVIILAASELTQELQLGIDIQAPMVKGDESILATMALVNNILVPQLATSMVQLSHHSYDVAQKEVSHPNS